MTNLRKRVTEDFNLQGLSEVLQRSYQARFNLLAVYFNKSPELLTIEDQREYFNNLIKKKNYSE